MFAFSLYFGPLDSHTHTLTKLLCDRLSTTNCNFSQKRTQLRKHVHSQEKIRGTEINISQGPGWTSPSLSPHFPLAEYYLQSNHCLSHGNTRQQIIICRRLFADHAVGAQPMKNASKGKLICWKLQVERRNIFWKIASRFLREKFWDFPIS